MAIGSATEMVAPIDRLELSRGRLGRRRRTSPGRPHRRGHAELRKPIRLDWALGGVGLTTQEQTMERHSAQEVLVLAAPERRRTRQVDGVGQRARGRRRAGGEFGRGQGIEPVAHCPLGELMQIERFVDVGDEIVEEKGRARRALIRQFPRELAGDVVELVGIGIGRLWHGRRQRLQQSPRRLGPRRRPRHITDVVAQEVADEAEQAPAGQRVEADEGDAVRAEMPIEQGQHPGLNLRRDPGVEAVGDDIVEPSPIGRRGQQIASGRARSCRARARPPPLGPRRSGGPPGRCRRNRFPAGRPPSGSDWPHRRSRAPAPDSVPPAPTAARTTSPPSPASSGCVSGCARPGYGNSS